MSASLEKLHQELNRPRTKLGRSYMAFMIATIFGSIFFMFLMEEYPKFYTHDTPIVIAVESFLLVAFSLDLLLRLTSFRMSDWRSSIYLLFDALAIIPSLAVVAMALGWEVHPENVIIFTLLRLFRLLRVLKLLRMGNLLVEVLGVSVFTMVFSAVATHLAIRVFAQVLQPLFGIDLHDYIQGPVMLMAVTAVGSAFGISMAITFGMVNKKREEVGELHRIAMDAVLGFERDFREIFHESVDHDARHTLFGNYRRKMDAFLSADINYLEIKKSTNEFLDQVRVVVKSRPSMDVPYHAVLVQRLTTFLTRSQSHFPPAFYGWMKLLANLYFILVMLAAPGIVGLCIQLLIIFVFYGLLMIIEDMDDAVDKNATLFNARILQT